MSVANPCQTGGGSPLQPGDRLSAEEFERRYEAMPEGIKAELIEGIVYMQASAELSHGQPMGFMTAWIGHYCFATPDTDYASDATDRLDDANQPQPDISLFIRPECGGQTRISDDGYLTGAPELVVEIAGSSVAIDRGPKLRTYEKHGVKEYLIWRVKQHQIEWYVRRDERFALRQPDPSGVFASETFPGLWLNVEAALVRDGVATMKTLDEGLATDQHAKFVRTLTQT